MESFILKHDGYIWGPWAAWKLAGGQGPAPSEIHCRFVSKSLFGDSHGLIGTFLIDLKQNFEVLSVKGREIKLKGGGGERSSPTTVILDVHGPADELRFMEETDYTCNLVDIRRTGIHLRNVPVQVAYEVSPFETVMDHIRQKKLVPVSTLSALRNYSLYPDWTVPESADTYIGPVGGECSICQADISLGVRTPCGHNFHNDCLAKWLEKSPTCPMCRDRVP